MTLDSFAHDGSPPETEELSDVQKVISVLQGARGIARNFSHIEFIPPREARYADFPEGLDDALIETLKTRGVEQLYTHQAQAVEKAMDGRNVTVVTPTASGKTMCFNLPVIQQILKDEESRALYLFPTKALSQDQLVGLYEVTRSLERDIKVYTFDGDTPAAARKAIRTAGQIVVTNPDMLHSGILPHHTLWIRLFENLKYVVIDETHHYRGVFGSHLANVLRRLKRVCKFYGSDPTFICASATIANPKELCEKLVEQDFDLVDDNGAPAGERAFLFYNPPVVNQELGIRRSGVLEAERITSRFLQADVQTIVFARSRMRVEILTTYLKRAMTRMKKDPNRVRGYRGGYLPLERRDIEQGVRDGSVLCVISTNALELGIDIGQLKAAVLAGYPGSVSSTWQQGGRAGRHADTAAVVLVATSSPLDQYIISHPEYFFGASPESGIINPDNLAIFGSHIKCAAFELPFNDGENFGDVDPAPVLELLEEENIVRHAGTRWFYSDDRYPSENVSLRSPGVENFTVLNTGDKNRILGEVDYDSAPFLIHEDAIYMHQSQTFFVERLDWDGRSAYVKPVNVDYYTDALAKTDIAVVAADLTTRFDELRRSSKDPDALAEFPLVSRNFGDVNVTTLVAKFKKIKFKTHENVGYGNVHTPANEMQTESYWLSFREDLKEWCDERNLDAAGGLRAIATVLNNVIPIFIMCDPRDIRCWPMMRSPFDERPVIHVYDAYPGGVGISKRLFAIDGKILAAARELVNCRCSAGCPSCVGPALEIGKKGKRSALALLERMLAVLAP